MHMNKMKIIGKLVLVVILLIMFGYILLLIAYGIPGKLINNHVKESVKIFEGEGVYPQLVNGYKDSQLDNWTDAVMLLIAVHEDTENSVFKRAAQNAYSLVPGKNPAEALVSIYLEDGEKIDFTYGRYWHGYLVFLKPLLVFFNYGEIRYLNMAFQFILIFLIMYLLAKQNKAQYGIAFCFYVLSLNPVALMLSMFFSIDYILTLLSIAILLFKEKQYKENNEFVITHFLIVGCLTSFFDLLSYPLHTLAVPLILWLSISRKDRFKMIIELVIAWMAGYGGMWLGKWIMGSLISGDNIFRDALDTAMLRTSRVASDTHFTYVDMLKGLFDAFNNQIAFIALIVSLLYIVACIWKHKVQLNIKFLALLSGIALMPFAWYAIMGNHSYWHAWFTFRELSISIFAILMMAVSCNKNYQ